MHSLDFLPPKTAGFLSQYLNSKDFTILQLAGDASSRRYFRVMHSDQTGDQTFVLMVWDPFVDDGKYPFLNVQKHFFEHKVNVPQVLAKAPDKGLVLLEDLGDLTLERKFWENQNQILAFPYYKMAIDEIVKIHGPTTEDRKSKCGAFDIEFDTAKLLWEMNYGREHLLEKLCGVKLSEPTAKSLQTIFTQICQSLHEEPKVICHRDYHSRNLMIKLNKMRVIDFQDARLGPVQYDLVSLVHDSYVDMNDELRNAVLEYYLEKAKENRIVIKSRDEFYSVFRLQILQRCFKACGSFASFFNMREDRRYLKYLTPTIRKVHATLKEFSEFDDFRRVIEDNGLLDKDFVNSVSTK